MSNAHSISWYLRFIEMHDYHKCKRILTFNDNHEYNAENVLGRDGVYRYEVPETDVQTLHLPSYATADVKLYFFAAK